jgi:hypothetical protein
LIAPPSVVPSHWRSAFKANDKGRAMAAAAWAFRVLLALAAIAASPAGALSAAAPDPAADEASEQQVADDAQLAPYRKYAARSKEHSDEIWAEARESVKELVPELAAAKRGIVLPPGAEPAKGVEGRAQFASRDEKQRCIRDLEEQLAAYRKALALRGHKWIPAPLPDAPEVGDMGNLVRAGSFDVVSVSDSEAVLRTGSQYFIYRGPEKGMHAGGGYSFAFDQVLRVAAVESRRIDGRAHQAVVVEADDLITLAPIIRQVFGYK